MSHRSSHPDAAIPSTTSRRSVIVRVSESRVAGVVAVEFESMSLLKIRDRQAGRHPTEHVAKSVISCGVALPIAV
jgi:hypothetical protein